jgi:hypothetical protein
MQKFLSLTAQTLPFKLCSSYLLQPLVKTAPRRAKYYQS